MNLTAAITHLKKAFRKLDEKYGRKVFDELAVVHFGGKAPKLLDYEGPREEAFLNELADDSIDLRRDLLSSKTDFGGEFSFTREGEGSAIDAFICLGQGVYLFCNNTEKSMEEITKDPAWLDAQGHFLNTSQKFAINPVDI